MPRDIRVYDLFVSSPSDVAEERESVAQAALSLSQNLERQWGLRINPIRWESHAWPGFGEDPQDVINQQLPEQYDIFIGILWARIGTPTKRAGSGTVEEFERAYEQWKADKSSIHLMLYFKTADIPHDQIDGEQFEKVREFKRSVVKRGCRYQDFKSTNEFYRLVWNHLNSLAYQHLASTSPKIPQTGIVGDGETPNSPKENENGTPVQPEPVGTTLPPALPPASADDDEGLLDLVEKYKEEMSIVGEIAQTLTDSMGTLGERSELMASELTKLDLKNNPQNIGKAKKVVNAGAQPLRDFAKLVVGKAPVMNGAFDEANTAFEKAIDIAPDFGEDGIEGMKVNKPMLERFIATLAGTIEAITEMRTSISRVPRATTHYNRAKREVVKSLDILLDTMSSAKRVTESSLILLNALG